MLERRSLAANRCRPQKSSEARPSAKHPASRPAKPIARLADRSIGGAEQQRAGIRGNLPTVEGGHHLTALDGFKIRTDRGYTLSASGISSGLV